MVKNKRKENEFFCYKNIILQEIAAVELYCFFYNITNLAFPTDVIVDFGSLPECGNVSQWDPANFNWPLNNIETDGGTAEPILDSL